MKKIICWLILCAAVLFHTPALAYTPESVVWDNSSSGFDASVALVGAVYDSRLDSVSAYDGPAISHTRDAQSLESKRPFFAKNGQSLAAEETTVGRWMSQAEYDAMQSSGRVQAPLNGPGATHVTVPPNPSAFTPQPSSGSIFVVPRRL